MKFKATVTTTLIYEVDPENYGTNNVKEMIKIDLDGLHEDCAWVISNPDSETTLDVIVEEE